MRSKLKLLMFMAAILMVLSIPLIALAQCPQNGVTPLQVGPENILNGFPLWFADSTGLAIELCLDPLFCAFDPVIAGNAFSQQIGFGEEGFWWSADAGITTPRIDGILVLAVEAAFIGDVADGEQFPFTRLRIRVTTPTTGTYRVIHPYGEEIFEVTELGARNINLSRDIPVGAFDSPHNGAIGPLLMAVNPPPPAGFLGDVNVDQTVTGSPCGTNFFRIEGPNGSNLDGAGNDFVQTDVFSLQGKIFAGVVPRPLIVDRATYTRDNTGAGFIDVFATSLGTSVLQVSGTGIATTMMTGNPVTGKFFARIPFPAGTLLPANITVTNTSDVPPTAILKPLTDEVRILLADFDISTGTLSIVARSSDALAPLPTLTSPTLNQSLTTPIPPETDWTLNSVLPLFIPPLEVTVVSSRGGSDTAQVTVLGNLQGATILTLVTHFYNSILDRLPEPGGAEFWTSEIIRIVSLGIDVKEGFQALGRSFFDSAEYNLPPGKTDNQFVTDLYETFLNRAPDPAGLAFWLDQLVQGLTRGMLVTAFANSGEFVLFLESQLGPSITRPEFNLVNDFYRGILNRLPDTAGFNSWVTLLKAAQCTGPQAVRDVSGQIASAFINSPEYSLRGRNDAGFVEDLYNAFLRRAADPAGFNGWVNALDTLTLTRGQVFDAFIASPEFQLRVDEVINAGCLP